MIVAFVGFVFPIVLYQTALWLAELTLFLCLVCIFTFDYPPMHGMHHASADAECMSSGDFALKFVMSGNYSDLEESLRRAPKLSPDALLAIPHDDLAGGDMPKPLKSYILKRLKQEGHDKILGTQDGSADFLMKLAKLFKFQMDEDNAIFTPNREVYVVNTEQVKYASKGRIAQPCECEGRPTTGNIFVVIDEDKFLSRTLQVKKMNILTQSPYTIDENQFLFSTLPTRNSSSMDAADSIRLAGFMWQVSRAGDGWHILFVPVDFVANHTKHKKTLTHTRPHTHMQMRTCVSAHHIVMTSTHMILYFINHYLSHVALHMITIYLMVSIDFHEYLSGHQRVLSTHVAFLAFCLRWLGLAYAIHHVLHGKMAPFVALLTSLKLRVHKNF